MQKQKRLWFAAAADFVSQILLVFFFFQHFFPSQKEDGITEYPKPLERQSLS